ncbi:MAG: hypothetical protein WCA47_06135, partial [Terriglobales bacterium]
MHSFATAAAGVRTQADVVERLEWSGWDGVGTAAVTLVGPIAYFTRVSPFGLLMDGIFPFAIHYTENRLDCSPQSRLGQLRLSGPDSD